MSTFALWITESGRPPRLAKRDGEYLYFDERAPAAAECDRINERRPAAANYRYHVIDLDDPKNPSNRGF